MSSRLNGTFRGMHILLPPLSGLAACSVRIGNGRLVVLTLALAITLMREALVCHSISCALSDSRTPIRALGRMGRNVGRRMLFSERNK